jgi:hypothetical protein
MQNGANGTSICATPMATSSHLRGQSPKAARFIHTEGLSLAKMMTDFEINSLRTGL